MCVCVCVYRHLGELPETPSDRYELRHHVDDLGREVTPLTVVTVAYHTEDLING